MRLKILLMTIMTAMLFIGSAAYADDAKDFPITGTVDLGVRSVQDGTNAKFQEYRDLKSGVFGNMNFGGDNGSYYVDMTGELGVVVEANIEQSLDACLLQFGKELLGGLAGEANGGEAD